MTASALENQIGLGPLAAVHEKGFVLGTAHSESELFGLSDSKDDGGGAARQTIKDSQTDMKLSQE